MNQRNMWQVGVAVAALVTMLLSPTVASANLLYNASFEIDADDNGHPDEWSNWSPNYNGGVPVVFSYEEDAPDVARTGDDAIVTYQWTDNPQDENGYDFCQFWQANIPATPGLTYTSSIWADNNWGDGNGTVTLTNTLFIKLEFYDAAGVNLGDVSQHMDVLPSGYHPYSLSATAPAGTHHLTAAYGQAGGYNWLRSVAFDDASLVVPEPTSLALVVLGGFAVLRRRR